MTSRTIWKQPRKETKFPLLIRQAVLLMCLNVAFAVNGIGCGSDENIEEGTLRELAMLAEDGNLDARHMLENEAETGNEKAVAALDRIRSPVENDRKLGVEFVREFDTGLTLLVGLSTDGPESRRRVSALNRLRTRLESGSLDQVLAIGLLNTIIPGTSIDDRRRAADKLARLSETSSDWDPQQLMEAVNELTRLIASNATDGEKRVRAARELSTRFDEGDLDVQTALELMEDVAPESAVETRTQALAQLTSRFRDSGNWDADDMMEFADELHTVTFSNTLDYEKKGRAAVDLTSEGIKRYGGDSYDDDDIDTASNLIKEAAFGDSGSLQKAVSDIFGR